MHAIHLGPRTIWLVLASRRHLDHLLVQHTREAREHIVIHSHGVPGLLAQHMLQGMPDGRCPYPPGDVPGPGKGFDGRGHWVGK